MLSSASELGASEGSQKAVGPFPGRDGQERFLLLVGNDDAITCYGRSCRLPLTVLVLVVMQIRRSGGAISAVEATCGECVGERRALQL